MNMQQESKFWNHWHYRLQGQGPCLVLIHGFPHTGNLWDGLAPSLSRHYRLLIPDLPGVGSSGFRPGITMDSLGAELGELLRAEGIDRYWLAGHSMGGYIALAHASVHAHGLVGISMIHSSSRADTEEKKEQRRKSIWLMEQGGKKPFIQQMIPALFGDRYRSIHADQLEDMVQQALSIPTESLIAFYEAMIARQDHQEWLRDNDLPVQWILGSEDRIAPAESLWPQTSLANRTFAEVMKGCGHMSMIEDPRGLENALLPFGAYIFDDQYPKH